MFILTLVFASSTVYFYKQLSDLKKYPEATTEQEVDKLVAQVGKLIVLPENEKPTVATVKNPENLRKQPFFANTKEGDRVLIYTVAKKAILYDPVLNKIVEVAPLTIGTPTPPLPETPPETATE